MLSALPPKADIRVRSPQVRLVANNGHAAFDISRLKTGSAASLTLNFLVTFFEKTFAFAILAFHFWLAGILLHVLSKSNAVGNPRQRP